MLSKLDFFHMLRRNDACVLMYHGVSTVDFRFPVWTQLPATAFEKHMEYLTSGNFSICTLSTLVRCLHEQRPFPKHAVAITFDDGFRNNVTTAYPILEKYQVPATIFLTTGLIGTDQLIWSDELLIALLTTNNTSVDIPETGTLDLSGPELTGQAFRRIVQQLKRTPVSRKNSILQRIITELSGPSAGSQSVQRDELSLMSWAEARRLQDGGLIEFGGHTSRHEILTRIDPTHLIDDLIDCKSVLDENLGADASLFAYPNGSRDDYDSQVIQAAKHAGWGSAVTTLSGHMTLKSHLFEIPRIGIGRETSVYDLNYGMSGVHRWQQQSFPKKWASAARALFTGRLDQ
jgi:peptidoglycan/xylan/chitin deacetylase (PgdA/CDA1 family)